MEPTDQQLAPIDWPRTPKIHGIKAFQKTLKWPQVFWMALQTAVKEERLLSQTDVSYQQYIVRLLTDENREIAERRARLRELCLHYQHSLSGRL